MEAKAKKKGGLVVVVIVLLVIVIALLAVLLLRRGDNASQSDSGGNRIGYASEGVTAVDEAALQAAVDDMYAHLDDSIALKYQNDATSADGQLFKCYICNSERNDYDMFIAIYGDDELTDELFVSELIKPSQAFEQVTLNRALEPGDHTVYVVFTQIAEENGEQVIHGQATVTMGFHVLKD